MVVENDDQCLIGTDQKEREGMADQSKIMNKSYDCADIKTQFDLNLLLGSSHRKIIL